MTIYDIVANLGIAYPRAFTPQNIISGYKVSGIYPYDRDFSVKMSSWGAYVTGRPIPPPEEGGRSPTEGGRDKRPAHEGDRGPT